MTRIHSTLIALVVGAAAAAGLYAAVHTVRLGQKAQAPAVSARELTSRRAKLVSWRRSLEATLAKRPPRLPNLPHFAPIPARPPSVATAQPRVTYVQPPTAVRFQHAPPSTTTTSMNDDRSEDDGGDD